MEYKIKIVREILDNCTEGKIIVQQDTMGINGLEIIKISPSGSRSSAILLYPGQARLVAEAILDCLKDIEV